MFQKVNDKMMLSDGAYSFGKKFIQVYLPAFSSLYFGLGAIWGLPAVEQVVGTCAVFATFIGACLHISSNSYDKSGAAHDGKLIVTEDEETGHKIFSLEVNGDPEAMIAQKGSLSFKVDSK